MHRGREIVLLPDAGLARTLLLGFACALDRHDLRRRTVLAEDFEADSAVMSPKEHTEVFLAVCATSGLIIWNPLWILPLPVVLGREERGVVSSGWLATEQSLVGVVGVLG